METQETKALPKSITIIARTWFDKVNGNSYFTAQILVDGALVADIPYEYGYGDYYIQRARELLNGELGVLNEEKHANGSWKSGPFSLYCRENGINLHTSITEVKRKKDL